MTILTPREQAEVLYRNLPEGHRFITFKAIIEIIEADRRALLAEDEETISAMDEAICERLNDDHSWMLDDSKPTPGRAALAALRRLCGVS